MRRARKFTLVVSEEELAQLHDLATGGGVSAAGIIRIFIRDETRRRARAASLELPRRAPRGR